MKQKYQDYPEGAQRQSILAAHSDGSEEKTIFKHLTPEELVALDKELAETAVTLRGFDEVLDMARTQHKSDTSQLKKNYEYVLEKIRAKGEEINQTVHKFFNHEEMTVEYFDNDGIFLESRAMMPSEKNAIFGQGTTAPIVRAINE